MTGRARKDVTVPVGRVVPGRRRRPAVPELVAGAAGDAEVDRPIVRVAKRGRSRLYLVEPWRGRGDDPRVAASAVRDDVARGVRAVEQDDLVTRVCKVGRSGAPRRERRHVGHGDPVAGELGVGFLAVLVEVRRAAAGNDEALTRREVRAEWELVRPLGAIRRRLVAELVAGDIQAGGGGVRDLDPLGRGIGHVRGEGRDDQGPSRLAGGCEVNVGVVAHHLIGDLVRGVERGAGIAVVGDCVEGIRDACSAHVERFVRGGGAIGTDGEAKGCGRRAAETEGAPRDGELDDAADPGGDEARLERWACDIGPDVEVGIPASEPGLEQVFPTRRVCDLGVGAADEVRVARARDAVGVDRDLDLRPVLTRCHVAEVDEHEQRPAGRGIADALDIYAGIRIVEKRPLVAGVVQPDVLSGLRGIARDDRRVVGNGSAREPIGRVAVDGDRVRGGEQHRAGQRDERQAQEWQHASPVPARGYTAKPCHRKTPPLDTNPLRNWVAI